MTQHAKQVVADGYDRIAEAYVAADRARPSAVRAQYLAIAMGAAPAGARALDLGCGTGELVTAELATRYQVVGVDISPRSIELARVAVPTAELVVGDISTIAMADASFDIVTAFFSLVHLPAAEQPAVLASIVRWLRPGGTLVATFDAGAAGDSADEDWLGVPMVWGALGRAATLDALRDAGFDRASAGVHGEHGLGSAQHLWVVATVPS
jgi:ubiquinone/menaquinone biosynthesis C-methylase UbiE